MRQAYPLPRVGDVKHINAVDNYYLEMATEQPLDSVVLAVISKFKARAQVGREKYGTTLDRQDLKPLDWIQHAQEELMDGILYLEKLKQQFTPTSQDIPQFTYEDLRQKHGC